MTETSEHPQRSKKRLWWLKWVAAILVLAMFVWEVGLPVLADRWAMSNTEGLGSDLVVISSVERRPRWIWRHFGTEWNSPRRYWPKNEKNFWLVVHMKNLEELHLWGIEIKDADLLQLSRLNKLDSIQIADCPSVTLAGVRKLNQLMPDCSIVYQNSGGTFELGPDIGPGVVLEY